MKQHLVNIHNSPHLPSSPVRLYQMANFWLWFACLWVGCCFLYSPQTHAKKNIKKNKKYKKSKKRSFHFPFAHIKLPKNRQTKLFAPKTFRDLKIIRKKKEKIRNRRVRPPTKRIKTMGSLSLQTKPLLQKVPKAIKKSHKRQQIRVKPSMPSLSKQNVRLVIYRRKMGRRGWFRKWLGHVIVAPNRKLLFKCSRPLYCVELKKAVLFVQQTNRGIKSKKVYTWHLRRALERQKGYEIEVQQISSSSRTKK